MEDTKNTVITNLNTAQQAFIQVLKWNLNIFAVGPAASGKSAVVDYAIDKHLVTNPVFVSAPMSIHKVIDMIRSMGDRATFIFPEFDLDGLEDLHKLPSHHSFVVQTPDVQAVMDFAHVHHLPILSAENQYDLSTLGSTTCCVVRF